MNTHQPRRQRHEPSGRLVGGAQQRRVVARLFGCGKHLGHQDRRPEPVLSATHPTHTTFCNPERARFQALGDSVVTGPTLTTVNHFHAILIG
ncbi:MAG: hypothetical protein H7274_23675 [Rhodoferax sp.]|nr:hypothetical protein [Rhodoferax sp.]